MLLQEFIHLTGVNVTSLEYQAIETEYLNTDIDKFDFCAKWKANYNNKMKKERAKYRKDHSIENLFSFMAGVVSPLGYFAKVDFQIDKDFISSYNSKSVKKEISLFWCVRKNGTGLYENKKDAETWANDWHDQFIAQYKVVLLNKLATIERIN